MQRIALFLFALLACTLAADMSKFCDDSPRPAQIDANTWATEQAVFTRAYADFTQVVQGLDLTSFDVQNEVGYWLRNYTSTIPGGPGGINRPTGFTITRSTGLIISNAITTPPSDTRSLENHNTRYEFMKATLCRDFGSPIVYETYFNERLNKLSRFYAKAIFTSTPNPTWHVFRINYDQYITPPATAPSGPCANTGFYPGSDGCCPAKFEGQSVAYYRGSNGCYPIRTNSGIQYADSRGCYPDNSGTYLSASDACPANRQCAAQCLTQ